MTHSPLDTLLLTHRRPLLRLLQRMVGNPCTAEDLLQDTYLRVATALARRPVEHLEPFIFQTARNLARDHLRARRLHERTWVEAVSDDVLHNIPHPTSALEQTVHAERVLAHLSLQIIARLSPRQQRVFRLNRLQGVSCVDIAEQLQVSLSTVQKELKLITAICVKAAEGSDH